MTDRKTNSRVPVSESYSHDNNYCAVLCIVVCTRHVGMRYVAGFPKDEHMYLMERVLHEQHGHWTTDDR